LGKFDACIGLEDTDNTPFSGDGMWTIPLAMPVCSSMDTFK